MKQIKEIHIVIAVLVIVFGGIGIFKLTGTWTTETTKVPVKFTTGELEGEYNPEDIRGSYTFEEISTLFEIPDEVLRTAFNIPDDIPSTSFHSKDLETIYEDVEIGNDAIKAFVATYLDIPYELADVIMPDQAVDILLERFPDYDASEYDIVNAIRLSLHLEDMTETPEGETDGAVDGASEGESDGDLASQEGDLDANENTEEDHEEPTVNGNTTFMQVIDAGVDEATIEEVIGGPIPSTAMTIKDYCIDNGLSFSVIKESLSDLMEGLDQ